MNAQLTFGLMSGETKATPIGVGDVIVTHKSRRLVVEIVDENIHGPVYVCVALDNGATCTVLAREVAYRSVDS